MKKILVVAAFAATSALAQTYPAKPIHLVVPFPPGGASDLTARTLGQKMSEGLGQPVVIDNKPGANGVVGIDVAAKAAPDGYTLLLTDRGSLTVNPWLYQKLPYDPLKDFAYVGIIHDERTFYFADTAEGSIRAYDVVDGELQDRRTFIAAGVLPGRPDGATIDAEGFLWSARYGGGGVARIDPAGSVERFLRLPVSQVSSVVFGGDDLRTLYVTTSRQRMSEAALEREPLAGALLAVDAGARGLPEPRYAM